MLLAISVLCLATQDVVRAENGTLLGTVTAGPYNSPVEGAHIRLRTGGQEHRTATDAEGRYAFPAVDAGRNYTLTVEADGLRPSTRTNVVVGDRERARVDVHLEIASAHDSVFVSGTLERRAATAEMSQRIEANEIASLPSVTRSVTKYALLDPHVRQAIGLGADFQDANRLSINAASYRHTGYVLDGVSTYDWIYGNGPQVTISPGAVRDVRVLSGQYPAQFGLSTTGVLSITTESGSDRYRGEGFAFVRPSGLQAKPPVSAFRVPNERSTWGMTVGGPLRSAQTYFFATYERADQDRGAYIQSPIPGFFTGESREQQGMLRIDHRLGMAHTLTVRGNASESTTNNANDRVSGFNQPSFGRRSHAQSAGGLLTDRAVFADVATELRVSFVSYVPDSATPLQPSVQIVRPNYSTEGYSTTNWVHARTWQAAHQLTFSRGAHTVQAGGELLRLHARDYSFTPLGTYTFAPGAPRPNDQPLTFSQTFGAADLTYAQTQGSVFVQDDIRLSSRLTAHAGLRYEAQSITDSRTNFAPRGGMALDLAGDGRTIVRAGAGLFYDQYYMYLTRRYLTLGPRSPQSSYTWSAGDPGFPTFPESFSTSPVGRLSPARDIMIPADRILNPYSRQFSVSLDRSVAPGLTLQVSGVHSHTFRQMRVNDVNHPQPFVRTAPNQVRTPQVANQSRPYTTYDGVLVRDIAVIENTAESIYKSIDIGLTTSGSGWGRVGAHYVRSWSTAFAMFYADANSGVPNEWWPDLDQGESGASDFHQPHRFVADATFRLPLSVDLSTVVVAASGLPVNPITGRDNNGDSYTVDRPVGLARNSFRAPAQFNMDLAIARRVRLHRAVSTELRLEVFNATNRRNYIRVNNVYGEGPAPLPTFLKPIAGVTNADPSRQVQMAVKVIF